ncbi:MAG: 50S ribosomal protein L24 [Patescibacteria group bacterium]
MKLKKGENVVVIAGKDRGQTGKIAQVFPQRSQVVVEGINLRKRRERPKKAGEKGQIVSVAFPLDSSKVMIKCDRCGRGVRVGYRVTEAKKIKICRRCQQPI